jgi:hypothetical protein
MAVSKNGGTLAVSNEDGWTAVELLGREGEISVGDTVFARDWLARGPHIQGRSVQGRFSRVWRQEMGAWANRPERFVIPWSVQ